MADMAAHLADEVLPRVAHRQWVLSVPWAVRYDFARDAGLLSKAVRVFVDEIFRKLCRRAGFRRLRHSVCGAVTAVQRFGSSSNLNTHFHSIVLDGVYRPDEVGGAPVFHSLSPPSEEDLREVLSRVRKRISQLLVKHGCISGLSPAEALEAASESVEEPETLDLFKAASIRQWVAMSDRPRRVEVVGRKEEVEFVREESRFRVEEDGYSLHAGVRVSSADREGLEMLCRYVLRPPFSEERLERLEDGRVIYRFRRARFDGATHVVLEPLVLLEKLAALVPPPRFHLLHYHGILAPHARRREKVVPARAAVDEAGAECGEEHRGRSGRGADRGEGARPRRPRRRRSRTDWATLLKRTLDIDVLACPRCPGRMVVLACITDPKVVRRILVAMGLWEEPPEVAPAHFPADAAFCGRSPPDGEFESVHDR